MSKELTDAKREAIKRYDSSNTIQIHLKLNKKTDSDIIDTLKNHGNIQGYIKRLIRADAEQLKNS